MTRRRAATPAALVLLTIVAVLTGGAWTATGSGTGPTDRRTRDSAGGGGTAPLTGRPDPTGIARRRPALNIKIENTPDARPQSGLDTADIVYEEQVEGGITRFWAVFDSTSPGDVGPVRSVRAIDPNIITPLGGIAAYSGGTRPNEILIRDAPVTWVDESNAGAAYYRNATRIAPHNLYAHASLLWQRAARPVPPPPLFHYTDGLSRHVGTRVAAVTLGFAPPYNVTYRYHPANHTWVRSYGPTPHVAASGRPLAPTNVIVQLVTYDGHGDAQLLGDAPDHRAWVLRDGTLLAGHWSKPDATTPTRYTDTTGAPIDLRPGRTWVELVPADAPAPLTSTGQ